MKNKLFVLFLALVSGALVFWQFLSVGAQAVQTIAQSESAFPVKNLMFSDVPLDHPNFDAIYFGYNTGFVQGYGAEDERIREYKPDSKISRAEFLKIAMEGTESATHKSYDSCFPDVSGGDWYATYVCQAKEEGVVKGYTDGTFRPKQTITEAEALKILLEIEMSGIPEAGSGEKWYSPYWDIADGRNIIPVENAGDLMTRGDIMEMVFRNYQVGVLKVDTFDEKYVPELMDIYDIPYDGVLGPGGMFGPGGAAGETGAGVYFADSETSDDELREEALIQILDESYFDENYCYFSDSGDYVEMVIPSLERITGGDLNELEVQGYDMDGFGTMFCQPAPVVTDLVFFDDKLRSEYDVTCWRDPVYSPSIDGKFENIFCYVESQTTEAGGGEDVDYDDGASEEDAETVEDVPASPSLTISATNVTSRIVAPDASEVVLLSLKFEADNAAVNVRKVAVHNFGQGSAYGIRRLYMVDKSLNAVVADTGELIIPGWDPVLTISGGVNIGSGMVKNFEIRGDFDWEYYSGNVELGILSAESVVVDEGNVFLSGYVRGSKIYRMGNIEVDFGVSGDLCALWDEESHVPYAESSEVVIGDPVAAGENVIPAPEAHKIKPINQGDRGICFAASTYSSLRWFEENLNLELIANGLAGLTGLIDTLHAANLTNAKAQLDELMRWVNATHPGCIEATYNTQSWWNVTCSELKKYKDKGCDIPLQIACYPIDAAGNKTGAEWGHAVDLVDVTINANDGDKCVVDYANSWPAGDGSGEDMDGLGAGRYEKANYDDDSEEFAVTSPWGADFKCRLYSAAYLCINKEKCN